MWIRQADNPATFPLEPQTPMIQHVVLVLQANAAYGRIWCGSEARDVPPPPSRRAQ